MYLVDLELTNVRAIRHMSLDFRNRKPNPNTRRWTVLLGENGCGKSTVLKSIGLLLAGSAALPDLLGSPDQWINNSAKRATIRATICTADGEERDLSLDIFRGDGPDNVIKRNAKGLKQLDAALRKADRNYFIAGYGAFRRPPDMNRRSGLSIENGGRRAAQLATMFTLGHEMVSLEQWVMDLDYTGGEHGREVIANALGKLLPGMHFKEIDKRHRTVVMETVDGDVPLRQLSEGYQAMAAWAGDLLFRMTETFKDRKEPFSARGVLLIDEMDLHLHPVWKRNLVDFLDNAFPNLQIIGTTHSPLSVQQCGEGELFVVRREADGPTLVPFIGDPSRMRLPELFLSPLIGLETLDSPKIAALREEARAIELKGGTKSAAEVATLRSLQEQLQGTTPLAAEEAPGFAQLMAFQKSQPTLDAAARMQEAQELFGTARVTAPAPVTAVKRRRTTLEPKAATPSTSVSTPNSSRTKAKVSSVKPVAKKAAAKSAPVKTAPAQKPVAKKAATKKTLTKAVGLKSTKSKTAKR